MRSLLNFLVRFSSIIVFLLLEVIALYMLYNNDGYHNIMLSNKLIAIEGTIEEKISGISGYFRLRQVNSALEAENLELRNRLERVFRDDEQYFTPVNDTIHKQQYIYTRARVIKQSVNRQKNFLTLDKGLKDGITEGMAVTGPDGIVGTIVGTSQNFSIVMSVLNLDFRLSAQFRKNGYYGSLSWNGLDHNEILLNEIPHHVEIEAGDTIETSGYSLTFPAGLMVGRVTEYDSGEGDFYNISVDPSTDFHSLNYVYVISNLQKEEQLNLQSEYEPVN